MGYEGGIVARAGDWAPLTRRLHAGPQLRNAPSLMTQSSIRTTAQRPIALDHGPRGHDDPRLSRARAPPWRNRRLPFSWERPRRVAIRKPPSIHSAASTKRRRLYPAGHCRRENRRLVSEFAHLPLPRRRWSTPSQMTQLPPVPRRHGRASRFTRLFPRPRAMTARSK